MKYLLILSLFINGYAAETNEKAELIGEGVDPSEEKFFYRELMSSVSIVPIQPPPIRIPPVAPPIRIPPVAPPIRIPPVQPPIRIPPVQPPIRIPPVQPPIRIPPVQPPIRIPPVQPPIRVPPVAPPIRVPPVAPPIRVPPTSPPILRIPPTRSPVLRIPPTSPPFLRIPPTSPPILRVPPVSPPILRIPPTSPPFLRIPPTSPPILRVPPVSPPILRVPPVTPPSLRVPPVTPPSLRVPPVTPPSLRVPPVTPPSLRVPPVTPPSLRVPPVSPPILRVPPSQLVPVVAPPNLRVPPVAPQRVPPIPPVNQPALRVPPTQVQGEVGTIGRSLCRCGGQVNPGIENCDPFLWQPTRDPLMHCFAHGGPNDPCSLNIMNDDNSGLNKDPIGCYNANGLGRQNRRYIRFDTFFLWDEPDTYGKSYTWAGQEWSAYANRFGRSIQLMRQSGIRFASPLFSSGLPGILAQHVNEFFRACGPSCSDPNSPAYIDIIAVNAYCRPSDTINPNNPRQGCRDAAGFFVDETSSLMQSGRLAIYITNWSRLNAKSAFDELAAMEVTDTFFRSGSRIQRVYWFGAIDNGIGTEFSFLTQQIRSGQRAGQTLGQVWRQECNCS